MRIGIGHPGNSKLVNKYVVQKGSVAERNDRLNAIENGIYVPSTVLIDLDMHHMLSLTQCC